MRQKRAKAYKKLMGMYELSFKFRQPYQILIDAGMCLVAQDHKIELLKQLESVLQGRIKPMITQCCIVELYKMGKERQPAVDLAKSFERRKCNHREAIEGDECLRDIVGDKNKHRYVIATQSHELRKCLRKIQAVPLVHVKKSVMVLEPPSEETLRVKEEMVETSLHAPSTELSTLPISQSQTAPAPRVRKKAKGPNPLSVKKKKPKLPQPVTLRENRSIGAERTPREKNETGEGLEESKKRKRPDDLDVEMGGMEVAMKKKRRRRSKNDGSTRIEQTRMFPEDTKE